MIATWHGTPFLKKHSAKKQVKLIGDACEQMMVKQRKLKVGKNTKGIKAGTKELWFSQSNQGSAQHGQQDWDGFQHRIRPCR